jgi:hypothetical protein
MENCDWPKYMLVVDGVPDVEREESGYGIQRYKSSNLGFRCLPWVRGRSSSFVFLGGSVVPLVWILIWILNLLMREKGMESVILLSTRSGGFVKISIYLRYISSPVFVGQHMSLKWELMFQYDMWVLVFLMIPFLRGWHVGLWMGWLVLFLFPNFSSVAFP